jgi:hypothetical protein
VAERQEPDPLHVAMVGPFRARGSSPVRLAGQLLIRRARSLGESDLWTRGLYSATPVSPIGASIEGIAT